MTTDELRAKFEAWMASWASWQAAHAYRDAEVEALRDLILDREATIEMREDDSFIERVMLRIPDKNCTESQFDEAIDAAMRPK